MSDDEEYFSQSDDEDALDTERPKKTKNAYAQPDSDRSADEAENSDDEDDEEHEDPDSGDELSDDELPSFEDLQRTGHDEFAGLDLLKSIKMTNEVIKDIALWEISQREENPSDNTIFVVKNMLSQILKVNQRPGDRNTHAFHDTAAV